MISVYERFKAQIILATFLAPIFGGAILYYGLRKHNEPVAKKANRLSWLAFLTWFGLGFALGAADVDMYGVRLGGLVSGLIGIALAIILLGKIKRASKVEQDAAVFD